MASLESDNMICEINLTRNDGSSEMSLLTVICPCYNHEKFISAALDSFVIQKTDFRFEVLIGDDASTDGTPAIIQEYAAKYPDIIKPILREKNLGPNANVRDLYQRITSKYVAICEGDDYWIDELKLQKQVNFLENHPGCVICFHPVAVWNECVGRQVGIFPNAETRFNKLSLNLGDLLKHNFIQTNSVVYRWRFQENDPDLEAFVNNDMQPADYIIHLMHAETGTIECLDEVMAVYRRHTGGIWAGVFVADEWFLKYGLPFLNFQAFKNNHFNFPQPKIARQAALGLITAALAARDFALLEQVATGHPVAYGQAAANVKNYITLMGKKGLLLEGLKWSRWRCHLLSRLSWGRKRVRYRQKLSELDDFLKSLTTE